MKAIIAFLALFALPATVLACPAPQPGVIFASCAALSQVRLALIEAEASAMSVETPDSALALEVTGAYTSGERVEPEGFFMVDGVTFDPYVQGWDGLAVIDAAGALTLHHVERVVLADTVYNLRQRGQRTAFVAAAEAAGASALQSHLIVVDGLVDVRPSADAPRYRRRIIATLPEGDYLLYDTGPRRLTLFEAAEEVAARFGASMAFNLDMGSYDYCRMRDAHGARSCGALDPGDTAKLSNLLIFTQDRPD